MPRNVGNDSERERDSLLERECDREKERES